MSKPFKLALIQLAINDEDKQSRLKRVEELLQEARGADLIMLPELWSIGYFAFDRYEADAETLDGEIIQRMRARAAALGAHLMMGSFVEKAADGLHNTSLLIDPNGGIAGAYRKIHLVGFGTDERRLLTPGKMIGTVSVGLGRFGLSTCFDLRFPELYRMLLDDGAKMFLVAAGWPHARLEHWRILTRSRAIENQAFLAAANCAGATGGKRYCGHSVIVDPLGRTLAEAGEDETILRAEIDLCAVDETRGKFPALESRVFK